MTVADIRKTPTSERLAFVHEHVLDLVKMTLQELNEVGRLLCHCSSLAMRLAYPIEGERVKTKQARFEEEVRAKSRPLTEVRS